MGKKKITPSEILLENSVSADSQKSGESLQDHDTNIQSLLYELEKLVKQLETVSLDEGILLYAKGLELASCLNKKLKETKVKLKSIEDEFQSI
jgi:exonuclease VII small subunit